MYNLPFVRCLALVALVFLSACASGRHINTLEDAVTAQKANSHMAVVFATFQKEESPSLGKKLRDSLLYGKGWYREAITFAGSPTAVNNEKLRAFADKHAPKEAGYKTVALGSFFLSDKRSFAYVQPQQYALYTYQSDAGQALNLGGWARKDNMAYGVFTVNPGDVLYLGHIKAEVIDKEYLHLTVEDHFEAFRSTLPADVQGKLQKRIMKFPAKLRAEAVENLRAQAHIITIPVYR